MSVKSTVFVGASVIVLAVGVNQALQPRTPDEIRRQQDQQQVDQLSDADGAQKDKMRQDGEDGLKTEQTRKTIPAEHRPRPHRRFRFRIP